MSPRLRALHRIRQSRIHKNAIAFFAKHARLLQTADFAFAASKRTAKTEGFLREEILPRYTAFFPLRHPERSAAHARGVEWISQRFFL
jgi:hypothetical protein